MGDAAAAHNQGNDPSNQRAPALAVVLTGADVRAHRERWGLSQAHLGRKLGYTQSTISAWERGRRGIPRAHYQRILDVFVEARREAEHVAATHDALNATG